MGKFAAVAVKVALAIPGAVHSWRLQTCHFFDQVRPNLKDAPRDFALAGLRSR